LIIVVIESRMGRDRSKTHVGIRSAPKLWSQNVKEEDHLGDVDVDGKMILKEVLQKQEEAMAWIRQARNIIQCWGVMNAAINIPVKQKQGIF
jgi:hypothetical protein